jgi:hypothetical protein
MPAANTSAITTEAEGTVMRTPTTNSPRLLKAVTADQEGDASEGKDGRDPQPDEESLLMAPREPQRDGEEEGHKGCDENGQACAAAENSVWCHRRSSVEAEGQSCRGAWRDDTTRAATRRPPRV